MKIKKSQLRQLISEMLVLEGKADDLVKKYPELKPAYDAGVKSPQYLNWLRKRRQGEPVEDIVGVIKSFDKAKQRLKAKGKSPDIYAYKSANELRQTLEDLGSSRGQKERKLKDEETTYLGEFGDWIVAMPHTKESSCQLGKGTTWCTAATQSQNLFLSYVASSDEDIVLYYLIKKNADSRKDPAAKLSVGFVNGEPILDGKDGHVSVDADNKGLNKRRLSQILGGQFEPIMTAMKTHSGSIGGKHPAKEQMKKIAKSKDPSVIDKYTRGMGKDERVDFLVQLLAYEISPEILLKLSDNESKHIRTAIARKRSTPPEILAKLADDEDYSIRTDVAENPSTPPEILAKFADHDSYVRSLIAANPSTPSEILAKLSDDEKSYIRELVASNPSYKKHIESQNSNLQERWLRIAGIKF